MGKHPFRICENKDTDQPCAVTVQLISVFVFSIRVALFLFYLYPKFQAYSLMLSLYRLVCVGPGRKPILLVFSCTGSYIVYANVLSILIDSFVRWYTCKKLVRINCMFHMYSVA